MVRSNREIVEEKLQTASVLNPGERDLLLVRTNLLIVDALERILDELRPAVRYVTDQAEREEYERAMDRDMPR